MLQQIIALIFILFFLIRIFKQRKKREISAQEFLLWLAFWFLAGLAIIFIKKIDEISAQLGFSGAGIDILLYTAVVFIFYLVFKMRIKLEKINREITKITREIALRKK